MTTRSIFLPINYSDERECYPCQQQQQQQIMAVPADVLLLSFTLESPATGSQWEPPSFGSLANIWLRLLPAGPSALDGVPANSASACPDGGALNCQFTTQHDQENRVGPPQRRQAAIVSVSVSNNKERSITLLYSHITHLLQRGTLTFEG